MTKHPEIADALEAHRRFYDAIESLDLDEMKSLWVVNQNSVCIHPGWAPVTGYPDVIQSWKKIFDGGQKLHFSLQNIKIYGNENQVSIHCVENIILDKGPAVNEFHIHATNVLVKERGRWKLAIHHASPNSQP